MHFRVCFVLFNDNYVRVEVSENTPNAQDRLVVFSETSEDKLEKRWLKNLKKVPSTESAILKFGIFEEPLWLKKDAPRLASILAAVSKRKKL